MDATATPGRKPRSTEARIATMPDTLPMSSMPAIFSPLAKALLDGFSEGVIVFDVDGRLFYANQPAREALTGMDLSEGAPDLQPRLAALGVTRFIRFGATRGLQIRRPLAEWLRTEGAAANGKRVLDPLLQRRWGGRRDGIRQADPAAIPAMGHLR